MYSKFEGRISVFLCGEMFVTVACSRHFTSATTWIL